MAKYSSNSNPYLSRKTYDSMCEWWSRSTFDGQLNMSKIAYELSPTGLFHAKNVGEFTFNRRNDANMRYSNSYVTIETPDDASAVRADDLVRFRGILYRVDNIVRREISKSRQFMRRPYSVYVLQLTR